MSDANDDKTKTGEGTQGTGEGASGAAPGGSGASGPRAPLSLKPRQAGSISTGTVRQSFSHGRTKTVVVETKRRAGGTSPVQRQQGFDVAKTRPGQPEPRQPAPAPVDDSGAGGLSAEEMEARRRAIALAQAEKQRRDEEMRRSEEAQRTAEAQRKAEQQAAEAAAESAKAQSTAAPQAPAKAAPEPAAPPAAEPVPEPKSESKPAPEPKPAPRTPAVNFGQRAPRKDAARPERPERPAFGGRSAREAAMARTNPDERSAAPAAGGAAKPSGTVRYSALNPRPAPARPGAPRGPREAAAAPPATPEVARPARTGAVAKDPRRDDDRGDKRFSDAGPGKAVSRSRGEPRRREGRLTIQALAGDGDTAERMRSLASVRRAREREKEKRKGGASDTPRVARDVVIPDVITVQELAARMAVRGVDVIKFLMRQGMMMKINDIIDSDTAELVATEFGHTVRRVSESDVETGFISDDDDTADTLPRPPVVTVMGHVDHGKTSLLDALRSTDVAAGEAGGITQHIGAYQVRLESGQRVTFLDTPGHAAFSAMRARGANVTDIVILVVAADDGVMPQTIEAINHAKAAGAPIIVAINKMDKPDADPTRVINDLLQHEIVVESLGGDTQALPVSALKREGLDRLIEGVLLQAEMMDLRANPERTADGVVIEAKLDKGRGPVATVLVNRGTLRRGEIVVAGSRWGRVRALLNERGEQLNEAGPTVPVEILGLDGAPDPGEPFAVVENEARARELTEYRERKRREKLAAPAMAVSLSDMMSKLQDKKVSELPVVIKADVQGSAEAIVGALDKMGTDEVRARIIHSGVGGITESDVQLAKSAGSPILGFNVRASRQARDLAEREGVEIRYYAIIYDLIDDIKGVLSGLLAPVQRETFLGNAEVLEVFDISKVGKVAGCRVSEGVVRKGARVRIVRDDVVVLELGVLQTLKRFKDEVNEVPSGQECGMTFQGFQDIKKGDLIECFSVEEIKRTL